MPVQTPQEIWETALGKLQLQVSKPNYQTWFRRTTGLSYQDNKFTIGVPNIFVAEYLEKTKRPMIEKVLIDIVPGDEVKIVFQVT